MLPPGMTRRARSNALAEADSRRIVCARAGVVSMSPPRPSCLKNTSGAYVPIERQRNKCSSRTFPSEFGTDHGLGASMNKEVPLNERLRAGLPELGGQLALAGQYLTQYPQDVAVCSMREIARRAAVPPVTLVRLAQRLGLSGWRELREHYVDGVLAHSATGASAATRNIESARAIVAATRASAGLLDFAQAFLAAEQELLRVAFAELNKAALGEAVSLLAEADRVFVVGRRTPFPAAFALAYALRKARPGVVLLDDAGGVPESEFEDVGPQDVLIAVTFAPFSRVTWTIAELDASSGARIVAISDIASAPVLSLA